MAENPKIKSMNFPNYFKNVAQSAIYSVGDSFTQEIFPTTHSFLDNNKETIRETVDSAKNIDAHFKKFSVIVKESEYVDIVKQGFKNLKEDLKSGMWNNQKRVRSTGIEGMEDFDVIMGDFSTGISSSVISGTQEVTKTMKTTSKITSDIMTGLTGQTIGAIGESTATLNAILDHHNNNISPFLKEATKYFTDSMRVQTEMNDSLKKSLEMQSSYYNSVLGDFNKEQKAPKQSDLEKVLNFDDTANIKEYVEVVKKNIKQMYMDNGGAMLSVTGEKDGMKALLRDISENPINFLIQQSGIAQKIIPKQIKESGRRFDETMKGFFSSALLKFNELAEQKGDGSLLSGFSKILGRTLGINTGFKSNVKADAYIKGAIPFDGVTKKAITDVIPMYLRKILSVLSGKDEILFNYESGMAESKKRVKERFDRELGTAGLFQYSDYRDSMLSYGKNNKIINENNEKDIKKNLDDTLKNLRGKKLPLENKKVFMEFLTSNGMYDPNMRENLYSLFSSLDEQQRMNFSNASIRAAKEATAIAKQMEDNQNMNSYSQLLSDSNINGITRNNTIFGNLESASEKVYEAVVDIKNLLSDTNRLLRRGLVVYPVKSSEARREAMKDARVLPTPVTTNTTPKLELNKTEDVIIEEEKNESEKVSESVTKVVKEEKKSIFDNIRNSISDLLQDPIAKISKGLDKASHELYRLIFGGKKDPKTGKSTTRSMKDIIDDFGKSVNDRLVSLREKMFGKKDDDGNLIQDGFLTPIMNSAKNTFTRIGHAFTGSKVTLTDGTVLDENPHSINNQVKAVVKVVSTSVKETIFGKNNVDPETGKVTFVNEQGLITTIKDSIVKPFESARKYIFGDKELGVDGKIIPKSLQDKIKKFAPKATTGALAGGTLGLLAPGGPLVGAIIGSTLSVSGAGEKFKEFMLGKKDKQGSIIDDNGVLNADLQAKIKKAVPIAVGTGVGALLGGMLTGGGIIGIVGAGAIGAMSQMESVKTYLFGEKDPQTNIRSGGLMGKMETHLKHNVIRPLEVQMRQGALKTKMWFTDNALNPLQDAVAPLKAEMKEVARRLKEKGQDLWDGVLTKLGGTFDNYVGKPMKEFFDDKFFNPMKKAFKRMLSGIGNILAAPFKALSTYTDGLKQKHLSDATYDSSYIEDEEKRIAERNKKQKEKFAEEQLKIDRLKEGYEEEAKLAGAADLFDSSVSSFKDTVNKFGQLLLGKSVSNKEDSLKKSFLESYSRQGIDLQAIYGDDLDDVFFNNRVWENVKAISSGLNRTDLRRMLNESANNYIAENGGSDSLRDKMETEYIEYLYSKDGVILPDSKVSSSNILKNKNGLSINPINVEEVSESDGGHGYFMGNSKNRKRKLRFKRPVVSQQENEEKVSKNVSQDVKNSANTNSYNDEVIEYGQGESARKVVKKTKSKVVGKINLSKLGDNIDAIKREVVGQLDGVGYNISVIKNILARQFGDAEGDSGTQGSRGNNRRKSFFGRMADKALNPFRKVKDRADTFIESVKEKLFSPLEIVKSGFEFVGNKINDVTGGLFKLASGAGKAISITIKMAGNAIKSIAQGAWTVAKEVTNAIWTVAKEVGPALWSATKDLASGAWTVVKDVTSGLGKALGAVTKSLYTVGKDMVSGVINFGGKLLGGLWNGAKNIVGTGAKFIKGRFQKRKEKKLDKKVARAVSIQGGYLDHSAEMMEILRNPIDVRIVESITLPISEDMPIVPKDISANGNTIDSKESNNKGIVKGSVADQKRQESAETKVEIETNNHDNLGVIATATNATNTIMQGLVKKGGFFSTLSKFAFLAMPFITKFAKTLKGLFGKGGLKAVGSFLLKGIQNILPKGLMKGVLGLTSGIKLLSKGIVSLPKTLFNLFTGKKGVKDIFGDVKDAISNSKNKNKQKLDKYGNKNSIEELSEQVLKEQSEKKATKQVAKDATKKGAKEVTEKTSKNVVKKGTEKATKQVAKDVTKKGAKEVTEKAGSKVVDKLIKNIDKILKSKAVTAVIGKEASEKIVKTFLPKLSQQLIKNSAKIAGGLSTGGLINVAFFVADLVSGFNKAHEIFGVSKGEATFGMKVAAGVSKAINGLVFAIIPESWMAEEIYKLFSSKKKEKELEEKQRKYAENGDDGVIEDQSSSFIDKVSNLSAFSRTAITVGGTALGAKVLGGKKKKKSSKNSATKDVTKAIKSNNSNEKLSPIDLMTAQATGTESINETLNSGIGVVLKGILDAITTTGSSTVEMLGEVVTAINNLELSGATSTMPDSSTTGSRSSIRRSSSSVTVSNKKTSLISRIGSSISSGVKKLFGKGGYGDQYNGTSNANNFTYYNQNDPRWSNIDMSVNGDGDTIGSAGCGPTAAAMALSAYGKNVDPATASRYAVERGYKVQGEGVDAAFIGDFAKEQGVNLNAKMKGSHSQSDIDNALSQGKPVLTLGRSTNSTTNPFTSDGHYVMITGKDGNGKYRVNDPLNSGNNNRSFSANELLKNTDVYWSEEGLSDSLPMGLEGEGAGATGKFAHPTPNNTKVTSPFGNRKHPVDGVVKKHSGIDLSAGTGVPIKASDGGTVTTSANQSGYGNVVYINHGNGYETRYAHASQLLVKKGDKVSQGQEIAKVGSTGKSTGPHLHFEIRKNGEAINPEPLLNGQSADSGVASNLNPDDFLNGMVYYSQGDSRWASTMYGTGTMKASACGPTSMAMVASSALGRNILPTETAKWSLDNGYRIPNAGTSHGFFPAYAKSIGLNMPSSWSNKDAIKTALANKQPVILSGNGSAPFTKGGHFVVATHTDGENVYINDPVSRERSIAYNYDTIIKQSKNAWISPKSNTGLTPGGESNTSGGSSTSSGDNKLSSLISETTNFLSAMILGDESYLNNGNDATSSEGSSLGTPSRIDGIPMGTKQLAEGVTKHKASFDKAEQEFGVESEVLQAIAMQESGGNANIKSAAWGLMQIENGGTTTEFINFGKNRPDGPYTSNDRLVPSKAIPFAAKRLSDDVRHYSNDYAKAIQAYNFSKYSLDKLLAAFPNDWMSQRSNIAKYNGHYNRTGKMSYGDPQYIEHVLRYYHGDALKGGSSTAQQSTNGLNGSGSKNLMGMSGRGTKKSTEVSKVQTPKIINTPNSSHISNTSMQLEALEKLQGNFASNNTINPTVNNIVASGSHKESLELLAKIAMLLENISSSNDTIATNTEDLKNKEFTATIIDDKNNNKNNNQSSNIFLGGGQPNVQKTSDNFLSKVNKIALGD